MIRSISLFTCPKPFFAATGNLLASSRRESTKLPFPCISRLATKAFQYVVEPKPVEVLRFTPASPKAAGIKTDADLPSGWNALPSRASSASNLPGPQLARTARTVSVDTPSSSANGCRLGDRPMIAPTFKSRAGHPSSRWPMPGANELSTVEWQSAHWMPMLFKPPFPSLKPVTPTTALRSRSASVVSGEFKSTWPAAIAFWTASGRASTSTFKPTASAVAGLTPGPVPP